MPYIKAEDRPGLRPRSDRPAKTEGELNFQLSTLISDYLLENGLNYEHIGDVRGALENAASEFYARVARPYEDTKIHSNGDVYEELRARITGTEEWRRREYKHEDGAYL